MNKIICFVVIICFSLTMAQFGIPARRITMTDILERETDSLNASTVDPIEQWYPNLVDHFNPLNLNKYQQRFWINDEFFRSEAQFTPIFITLCCEGACSSKWTTQGLMYDWAKETQGLLVSLEHRYYGKSQPFENWKVENLAQLTMEQALADAAYFIKHYIIKNYNREQRHPVIVAGGSYGGTMVASMRHNYPNLVQFAVSASGVFDPKLDLSEFLEEVIAAYKFYGGSQCVADVSTANSFMTQKLLDNTVSSLNYVSAHMPLCTPLSTTDNKVNRQAFWSLITDSFIQIVQYNKENGPGFTVQKMCQQLANSSTAQAKFENLANIHANHVVGAGNCYRWTFEQQVEDIGNVTIDDPNRNLRQWYWQTVSAYGWYQPLLESTRRVFGGDYDMEYFMNLWKAAFGPQFTQDFIEQSIKRTHAKYNQYEWRASNVLFTVGQFDPWKTLHVNMTRNDRDKFISTYMVNSTSHCAPLYQAQTYDSPHLKSVRQAMYRDLQYVLANFPYSP